MDLNDIVVFTQVVKHGSFIGASRALGMPRSTVSRKISDLEQRLGARLLHRTTRRLNLTDVGETYYQRTAGIIAQIEEADLLVTRLQEIPRGRLRVTAPMNFGQLAPVVAAYLDANPEVQVELTCTDRVVDLVAEGFDVAIRVGQLSDSALVARPVGALRSLLVASPEFVTRHGAIAKPAQLEGLDCLVFGPRAARGRWVLQGDKGTSVVNVQARLSTNDFDHLQHAVRAGLGIALLPIYLCSNEIRDGQLCRVLPGWCSQEVQVHAVYPSARLLSPKVKVFVEHLRAHLGTGADAVASS